MPENIHGPSSPQPGWYPVPQSPSLRWWDGQNWTDQWAPPPATPPNTSTAVGFPATQSTPPLQNNSPQPTNFQHLWNTEHPASLTTTRPASTTPTEAPKRTGRRLVIELVALGFLLLFTTATVFGIYRLLGFTDRGTIVGNFIVAPILAAALGYFLFARSRQYGENDSRGPSEGARLHRKIMLIGGSIVLVVAMILAGFMTRQSSTPTLSGSELQTMMREQLGPAAASGALTGTIACPTSRSYSDGDVARCTMNMLSGSQVILVATIYRTDNKWRINLDIG
ncbi:DUF2510 domain-containing protein [Rhodococcus sp. UFZ-B548]|uniref:DUF2510 domain-containing protein n=1 Tax=Rhodococcus sp. UFZ-B548 TaxID=2742212 RepID=UPI002174EE39|nr:DUF2510 domain-containing protein [Rhodococcus sp. UFZ-B548]